MSEFVVPLRSTFKKKKLLPIPKQEEKNVAHPHRRGVEVLSNAKKEKNRVVPSGPLPPTAMALDACSGSTP